MKKTKRKTLKRNGLTEVEEKIIPAKLLAILKFQLVNIPKQYTR